MQPGRQVTQVNFRAVIETEQASDVLPVGQGSAVEETLPYKSNFASLPIVETNAICDKLTQARLLDMVNWK